MELTFGTAQIHTSKRMKNNPKLAKLLSATFGYTNIGNYARFRVFKRLINSIQLNENAKILDLGAGYGEYSISMATAMPNADVHALDIDKSRATAIEEATNSSGLKNIIVHNKYIENLDQKDFDLIFSVDVFEHILKEEMPFKSAFEKLKSGGQLIVKIPNVTQQTIFPNRLFEAHNDWLEDEHIGQVYDLIGLTKRFIDEGFQIVQCSYSDGWFSRLGWELAYLGKKLGIIGQLLTIPIAKSLIWIDRFFHRRASGNAIQVIGQKP